MAKDFSEIPDTIHDVKDAFIRGVLFARRKLVVNLVVDLARNTPVDTSKALSNWEVGATSSKFSYGSAHVKGKRGSTREASIALTKAAADRESSSIPLKDPVHVGNAAPYIRRLDAGWSKQRPEPWIERTARESVIKSAKEMASELRVSLERIT